MTVLSFVVAWFVVATILGVIVGKRLKVVGAQYPEVLEQPVPVTVEKATVLIS